MMDEIWITREILRKALALIRAWPSGEQSCFLYVKTRVIWTWLWLARAKQLIRNSIDNRYAGSGVTTREITQSIPFSKNASRKKPSSRYTIFRHGSSGSAKGESKDQLEFSRCVYGPLMGQDAEQPADPCRNWILARRFASHAKDLTDLLESV